MSGRSQQRGAGVDLDDKPILFRPKWWEVIGARNAVKKNVHDPEERALIHVMIGVARRDQVVPGFERLVDEAYAAQDAEG